MENRICLKCGNEVPENAKFCIYCGTPQPEEAPMPESVSPPETEVKAPMPEPVSPPETEVKAPMPEPVSPPETEVKAPMPEPVSPPETEVKAPVPEPVSPPETEVKAPMPESVSPPETEVEAPIPEPVSPPETEVRSPKPEKVRQPQPEIKAPMPDNRYRDYSYEPQSYEVENGNNQGAGSLVVFLLVAAMIVVGLVVCMIMAASAFVNKSIKQKDKELLKSSEISYGYDGYDDDEEDSDDDYDKRREILSKNGIIWVEDYQKPIDGFFKSGDYKVGEDIPAGTYFLKANIYKIDGREDSMGYRSISYDAAGDDDLIQGWFEYTCYVELKEGTYLHISHCAAYDISKCPVENDPFEHPGTFMVGIDIEPGTYELSSVGFDRSGKYAVYESIEDIGIPFWVSESKALYSGTAGEGDEITVKEGQFLELENAVLVHRGGAAKYDSDAADAFGEVIDGSD